MVRGFTVLNFFIAFKVFIFKGGHKGDTFRLVQAHFVIFMYAKIIDIDINKTAVIFVPKCYVTKKQRDGKTVIRI